MAAVAPKRVNVWKGSTLVWVGLVLLAAVTPISAAPTVEQMLSFKPRQEGVDISTPTKDDYGGCEVKLETGKVAGASGWVLIDAKKQTVRKFFDSNGDKKIDVWSYYKDGIEVYREIDTKLAGRNASDSGRPDQFRWFNAGGTRWGVDANEDGKIESWRMISAEEAAQEVYQAVTSRDYTRLQAVLINEQELSSLRLPDIHTARIRDNLTKAQTKFQALCSKATNLTPNVRFIRVESGVPHCIPADAAKGPAQDLLRFPTRAILYQVSEQKHEWLHTGEIIQVGLAWRLTDAPSQGEVDPGENPPPPPLDEGLKKLMDELMALDKNAPTSSGTPGKFPAVVEYNTKRAALLEKIIAKVTDPKEQESWMRQILDNLCTGHQANKGDNSLLDRLTQYKSKINQSAPGSKLAGYAHYREMWARFSFALFEGSDPIKTQREWTEELAKFVSLYPRADDDAPDALRQLAVNSEYSGKEKQDEAKKYWGLIVSNFPDHALAPLARGALKRLDLTGKPMELTGPTLQGSQYEINRSLGKVVVVYYWASNCKVCVGDFAVMKQMQATYAAKGLEIVTVCLDETQSAATAFVANNLLPAHHLFLANDREKGMEGPLAVQHGIVGLPTIFLVGKDGRVIDRSIQMSELEDAVKKGL